MDNILAIILAGGRGKRLSVLTQDRVKPAVPFAGKYRLIDFTLSNCVNSGIHSVVVLTQYNPLSLAEHIGIGTAWGLTTPNRGIRLLQPYLAQEEGRDWYTGTADAMYQNFKYIEDHSPELVLVLSGDHVCRMDYSGMLQFHQNKQADVTLAFTQYPEAELYQFGTVAIDIEGRVISFQEKVKRPKSDMVSMGIYLFNTDVLQQCLEEDVKFNSSRHDFGRDIFPKMVAQGKYKIFAYGFSGYWRDVGTIQNYWQSNIDMIEMSMGGFLSNTDWPIRTNETERPPSTISEKAKVTNSLISNGCVIEGNVERSVLSPGVIVSEGATVKDSIILSDSIVGSRSIIDYSILDKQVVVEAGCYLGFGNDFQINHREPKVINSGITIVGRKAKIPPGRTIGRNCVISCNVTEDDFLTSEVQSGETIAPSRRNCTRKDKLT
ncbi:glucose-1-phosphate adenylyltransferase subunit GlgD [Chloroflexota bacterium]